MADTAQYILQTVAPIFNRKGYVGTSLSDLTQATGLTKGAIYGNFLNKEDLALHAFQYTVKRSIKPMYDFISQQPSGLLRLYAITEYQRQYYNKVKDQGGCPIIRVGVDAKFNNPLLFRAAKRSLEKFLKGIGRVIQQGIDEGSLRGDVDTAKQAKIIYTIIEGSLVTSFNHLDRSFIDEAMDYIDLHIIGNLIK